MAAPINVLRMRMDDRSVRKFSQGGGHNAFTAHEQRESGERLVLDVTDSQNLGVGPPQSFVLEGVSPPRIPLKPQKCGLNTQKKVLTP